VRYNSVADIMGLSSFI